MLKPLSSVRAFAVLFLANLLLIGALVAMQPEPGLRLQELIEDEGDGLPADKAQLCCCVQRDIHNNCILYRKCGCSGNPATCGATCG